MGDSVRDLRAVHSSFLTDFQQTVTLCTQDIHTLHQELQSFSQQINVMSEENRKLEEIIQKLNQEADEQNDKILELRQHLRQALQENQQIKELQPELVRRLNSTNYNFDTNSNSVFAEPMSPKPGLKRNNSASSLSLAASQQSPHYASTRRKSRLATNSMADELSVLGGSASVASGGGGGGPTVVSLAGRGVSMALTSPVAWLQMFREDVQRAIDEKKCRVLTLKECKEVIVKVYESKAIANDKALLGSTNHPMETLEQHTYRILEKKYGLRALAVEHAGMLLQGLAMYSNSDHEVLVFLKIFRNEVEENYRLIVSELVKSIRDLTGVQLMGRNPTKDMAALGQLVEQKVMQGVVQEDEWRDMIGYLYNVQDAAALGKILRQQALLELQQESGPGISAVSSSVPPPTHTHVLSAQASGSQKVTRGNASYVVGTASEASAMGYDKQNARDQRRLGYASQSLQISLNNSHNNTLNTHSSSSKKQPPLKLSFRVFLQLVLQYQLSKHQEYLARFGLLFRQFDTDVDGVLSGAEFKALFHVLWRQTHPRNPTNTNSMDFLDNNNDNNYDNNEDGEDEEELHALFSLVKAIDPCETDRFIFSSTVICLQKLQ